MKIIVNISVIPNTKWLIVDAHNKYCSISIAIPNNHIIYRLIKISIKLYLLTVVKIILTISKLICLREEKNNE